MTGTSRARFKARAGARGRQTRRSARREAEFEVEVVIVGGGMVGLTLGLALAGAGLPVAVIERADPARVTGAAFDGRASAIARGSQQVLAALGIWPAMAAGAQEILHIRVSDGRIGLGASSLFLHCDYRGNGAERQAGAALGYIVENRITRIALMQGAKAMARLELLAPAQLDRLEQTGDGEAVEAVLTDGRRVRARLAVAADGRESPLRKAAGIRVTAWDYPQSAIVCTLGHERPHHGVAHEHFLPAGPFALLPMTPGPMTPGPMKGEAEGTPRSSLIWTERADLAPAMMALDAEDFARELERRFGGSLGKFRQIGGRWCYPLSLLHAERYLDRRLVLVGDAAHVIHPIAGQGLNLGLRDVAALAQVLVEARRLGRDLGSAQVLADYQRWRRFDNSLLMVVTDGLNRLFSNDLAPLRLVRDLGLAAVNEIPPLKRLLMRHAMGLVGELPRLIRGQAL